MKKLYLIGIALLAFAFQAAAVEPAIVWMASVGVFAHNSPEVVVDEDNPNYIGVAGETSVTWQLLWAGTNNVADPIDYSAADFTSGDDYVIGSRLVPQGGSNLVDDTLWTDDESGLKTTKTQIDAVIGGLYDENEAFYVFQRVFEDSNPHYNYQTELTLLDSRYTDGAQKIYVDIAGAHAVGVRTSIPEPATMSLLGLGALAMVLRRKLRK